MWKGAGEKWKYGLMYRLQRQEYNKVRSEQSKKRMTNKRQEKDEKLKALLKSCGLGNLSTEMQPGGIQTN